MWRCKAYISLFPNKNYANTFYTILERSKPQTQTFAKHSLFYLHLDRFWANRPPNIGNPWKRADSTGPNISYDSDFMNTRCVSPILKPTTFEPNLCLDRKTVSHHLINWTQSRTMKMKLQNTLGLTGTLAPIGHLHPCQRFHVCTITNQLNRACLKITLQHLAISCAFKAFVWTTASALFDNLFFPFFWTTLIFTPSNGYFLSREIDIAAFRFRPNVFYKFRRCEQKCNLFLIFQAQ